MSGCALLLHDVHGASDTESEQEDERHALNHFEVENAVRARFPPDLNGEISAPSYRQHMADG